jgi:hypothetical protein
MFGTLVSMFECCIIIVIVIVDVIVIACLRFCTVPKVIVVAITS